MSVRLHDRQHGEVNEHEILYALTNPHDNQPPWSLDDLGRVD